MHGRCGYQKLAKLVAMPLQIIIKKFALLWLGSSNVTLNSCVRRRHYAIPFFTHQLVHEQQAVFLLQPTSPPLFPPIAISYQNCCWKGTGVYGLVIIIGSGPMLSTAPIQLQALGTRAKRISRLSHLLPNRLTINTGKNISDA